MTSIQFQQTTITQYSSYFNQLPDLSLGQSNTARALLQQLDGFGSLGGAGGFAPSLAEMMLPSPMGYLRGGAAQSMAMAAGFLQGLQASSMMDLSIGSRMLMGLQMFSSGSLGAFGGAGGIGQAGFSVSNFSTRVGGEGVQEKDRFATHEGCRTGADTPSNLNNSPHVKLALYNILKDHNDDMPADKLKSELKDRYGIEAELTTVKGDDGRELKALKFQNGDVFADGSGNGSFGMVDYDLKGAVKDIQDKYGVTPEDFDKQAKENKDAGFGNGAGGIGGYNEAFGNFQSQFQSVMSFGQFQPFFPMQELASAFAQAWMFASRSQDPLENILQGYNNQNNRY